MPGPHRSQSPPRRWDEELTLDELTQQIDAPLADLVEDQEEPTLSTLDFEDIDNALDW